MVRIWHKATLLWRGYFYRPAPEEPILRGMPTGPELLFYSPGVSGLRPCALTHLKKALCCIRPFSGVYDKYLEYVRRKLIKDLREES